MILVKYQKGFVPVLIVVLVATLLGGYFLYSKQFKSVLQQPSSTPTITSNESSSSAETANWKAHTNIEGSYSFQYPPTWVVEIFKEKYPNNVSYDKAHVIFQSRATTDQEKVDDKPGLPVDMATGSIKVSIAKESFQLVTGEFNNETKISEQDYFNLNNSFWPKGNIGGGGPGHTYSNPEEIKIAGKRAVKQESHPTKAYEWVGPNQISIDYYIWLGNSANEVIQITFTYDNTNPDMSTLIKKFNQILSTFKVTQ